jgi:NadR type nicotinamide-nucleotide adenylyltransferase
MIKKIVILGPESTGKSTLCAALADHYKTSWVPEYARSYLLEHSTNYQFDELLTIAKGQLALEDSITTALEEKQKAANKSKRSLPLFIDTDMYVMKVWCEFVFKKCHRYILEQIVERKYDHYLLCDTDLPWVQDELREYPDQTTRDTLLKMYTDCMIHQPIGWTLIRGEKNARLEMAIRAVDAVLSQAPIINDLQSTT